MNLNSIYNKLPAFLQNISVSAYGFIREKRRFGGEFKKYYNDVLKSDFADNAQKQALQSNSLRELFRAAAQSVYYKEIFSKCGVDIEHDDPFEILSKLPILEKDSLRGHEQDFYTKHAEKALVFHTSGSTGTPLNIKMSLPDFRLRMALLERQKARYGVSRTSKHLTFVGKKITSGGNKTFWRYNFFGHQLVMSVYDLSEQNKERYLSKMQKYAPEVIEGYPSALVVIANWLINSDYKIMPKCVFATAETLTQEQREIIEKAFGCPVINYYGSTEGSTMITQCEKGNLHIDDECGIIEFLNNDGSPAKCGETANMIITSFTTRAMPLIRYNIGDLGILSDKKCDCGRCSAVVTEIVGRMDDIFVTPEKGHVGRLSTTLKLLPATVRRAQIHQYSPTDFTLLLETDTDIAESELTEVYNDLYDKLGKVNIVTECTPKIPGGSNGKFRAQIKHFK